MIPIKFPEANVTYAENQPECLPLPVHKTPAGEVTSCWQLTEDEITLMVKTGKIYITQLTFNQKLQPVRPAVIWDNGGN